jgi:hypothetical protein
LLVCAASQTGVVNEAITARPTHKGWARCRIALDFDIFESFKVLQLAAKHVRL